MNLNLKGKYALVTGGSHGIGRAIALSLAKEGCDVAICARDQPNLDITTEWLKYWGVESLAIRGDVLVDSDMIWEFVMAHWGHLDILINNVGGGGRWGTEQPEEALEDVWLDVYNKNALTAMRFTMMAIPVMKKQGWGRVVTIASIYGREGGGRPWFNMAKAAEISLMKTLAMNPELRDITFNSVAPSGILIPDTGWAKLNKEELKKHTDNLPLGRLGTPEEVAAVVTFLCSNKSSFVNGACIAIDGGESHAF